MIRWRVLLGGAGALVAVCAAALSFPWWYSAWLWRPCNTPWLRPGPGFDPLSYNLVNATLRPEPLVPRILHQTWRNGDVPPQWRAAQQSCIAAHPGWEYKLWTDAEARALVAREFPELLPTYDGYRYGIQRADAFRYVVLHALGGVYLDLDVGCLHDLELLRGASVVLPKTRPVGFSNDILAARKGDAFMLQLVRALPRWDVNLLSKYPTVMFSTGPMFVTMQANLLRHRRSELAVLPDGLYNKYAHAGPPLFYHLFGSSWHGADARAALLLVHRPLNLALGPAACLAACLLALALWRGLLRALGGRQRRGRSAAAAAAAVGTAAALPRRGEGPGGPGALAAGGKEC